MELRYLLFLPIVLLTGCASPLMSPTDLASPTEDQAVITFYRNVFVGSAIQAPIAEEVGDDVSFVGISSKDTKIQHVVAPGKHRYVVGGESSHLLEADVEAGKSYYAKVDPRMGWLKARFHLVAQKGEDSEDAMKTVAKLNCVAPNEEGQKWFENHRKSMLNKLRKAKEDHKVSNMAPADGLPFAKDANLNIAK